MVPRLSAALVLAVVTLGLMPRFAVSQGPEVTQFAGQELRTTIWAGDHAQYHLWRFAPNGAVSGVYTGNRTLGPVNLHIERNDVGRWSVEGGALCVQWQHWFDARKNCYRITRDQGSWVTASNTGPGLSFKATLAPFGP